MLTAQVGENVIKARLSAERTALPIGSTVWLQLVGEHTCYYVNEELVP